MKNFLIVAVLSAAWIALLQTDIPTGKGFVPSLGKFLHPLQGVWASTAPTDYPSTGKGIANGSVRILFDERDVPHIYADNLNDALFAQGYLHAANRLFQMEVTARSTGGYLSEWLGGRTLAFDKLRRETGMEWLAERKVKAWKKNPGIHNGLEAYVAGVNSVVSQLSYKDWPVEYKILNQSPSEWTLKQTALVGISMSIALCYGEKDLEFTKALQKLSPEEFEFYYPSKNPLESPVISSVPNREVVQPAESIPVPGKEIKTGRPEKDVPLNGSNNWAVHGSRTTNGFPLLANDPHLNLTLPSIWYELEIHTPDMHVHGVSIPGIPYIIIGFNEDIAWGTTNSGQDVRDWYHITWENNTKSRYQLDGKFENVMYRIETIPVRGNYPVTDTVRYTYFGPVSTQKGYEDMAVKWLPFTEAEAEDVKYPAMIDRATDFISYSEAVASFSYPSQNKVLASREGDVAMRVSGLIPLRNPGAGEFVQDGNTKENDWKGYVPFAESPVEHNPTRGYVSSANQQPTPDGYPYPPLGRMYFEDYRGRMANIYLDSFDKATVADMQHMQLSAYNLQAAEVLPHLLNGLSNCTSSSSNAAMILSNWNYVFDRDSVSPIYYHLWYSLFKSMVFDELEEKEIMYPEEWRVADLIQKQKQHDVFDIKITAGNKETFEDICCLSFQRMLDSISTFKSEEVKNWGAFKHSFIQHIARLPGFGIPYVHASGGQYMLNAMGKSHGPSWRMIVEMSDPPKAWVNYPGGQSGNPASKHYADMVEGFFEGKYYEVTLKKDPQSWDPVHEIVLTTK